MHGHDLGTDILLFHYDFFITISLFSWFAYHQCHIFFIALSFIIYSLQKLCNVCNYLILLCAPFICHLSFNFLFIDMFCVLILILFSDLLTVAKYVL